MSAQLGNQWANGAVFIKTGNDDGDHRGARIGGFLD
jgi:hypothetical protein